MSCHSPDRPQQGSRLRAVSDPDSLGLLLKEPMSHSMSLRSPLTLLALVVATTLPMQVQAADPPVLWQQVPSAVFIDPLPGYWTTKIEIADINDDGWPDILFANVGGYQAGTPDSFLSNQAYVNEEGMKFANASIEVFGEDENNLGKAVQDTARVIKAADLDGDGDTDIVVGTTWASQSRLYLNEEGFFVEHTELLPQVKLSAGDLEIADVDGDGDPDIVISDWGQAPVGFINSPGGVTHLWINDGNAMFTDETAKQMPAVAVNWSWDHEFLDIDNDWDLDLLVACRACASGSFLFLNDGLGGYTNATPGNLPQAIGNVDFEIMDIDGDGYVDTYTLQDGPSFRNRILINSQDGGFIDKTALWWEPGENPSSFDYMGAFLDYDSDGYADILLGAFGLATDRLLRNTGTTLEQVKDPDLLGNLVTDGTYAIAVADFNGDAKIDLVLGEGENSFRNRVFFGEDIAADTGNPVIGVFELKGSIEPGEVLVFHGRVHDNKTPQKPHDWSFVGLQWVTDGGSFDNPDDITSYDLEWYGEHLWRTQIANEFVLPEFSTVIGLRLCAIDAALNETCIELVEQYLCGDGKVNSENEQCDGEEGCLEDCTWAVECGNGIVQDGEECDDGNNIPGDGCEDDCTVTDDTTTTTTGPQTDTDMSASMSDTISSESETESESESESDSETVTDSNSNSDTATTGFDGELDDDGCGCTTSDNRNAGTGLLLVGLLALRRRRRR